MSIQFFYLSSIMNILKFNYFFYYTNLILKIIPYLVSSIGIVNASITNMVWLLLKNPSFLLSFAFVIKYHTNFRFMNLVDISVIDYPFSEDYRFELYYIFLNTGTNASRLMVRLYTFSDSYIDSLTSLFSSSNWLEREVYDMFGVFFLNHPDLRRILTDYGFEGFPLRKDFPLTGYTEIRFDEEEKRILVEPVNVSQLYRNFNFDTPWEDREVVEPLRFDRLNESLKEESLKDSNFF